jgi:hypothetical protein
MAASTPGQAALQTALLNIQNQLAAMTATPKPTYSLDGVSYSWGEHFRNLVDLQKEISAAIQREDAAFEVVQLPSSCPGAAWPGF